MRKRGDKKIAEAMSFKVPMFEAELKQLRKQVFILRQRHHAVSDVSRRQHLEVFSETSRRPPTLGHLHHRRKPPDRARQRRTRRRRVLRPMHAPETRASSPVWSDNVP